MKYRLIHWITQLVTARSTAPEQSRRGRILGILLLGLLLAAVLAISVETLNYLSGTTTTTALSLAASFLGMLALAMLLYLNRRGWTRLVSYISMIILSLGVAAIELNHPNRVDLLYVVPIAASSFVISPGASFIFATLSALGHTLVQLVDSPLRNLNVYLIYGMYLVGLMAWLTANNLEAALREIQQRAGELDRRVMSRTRDLVEALEREHISASKLQAILHSISDGVIVFDSIGRAIVANSTACSILECRENDILGKRVRRIMDGSLDHEDQRVVTALVESKLPTNATLKIVWGRKTVAFNFAPVQLPSAQQEGIVMVLRDITREAEVDRMKSEFVSIVSHELRTPMTAIKGYLDLLALGSAGAVNEMQRHYLSIVKANADRLNDMVNELLDLSHIESGKAQINLQAIPVRRILYEVVAVFQKTFNDRGIRLRVDVQENLPDALADPGRLTQVVTNLLSNAAKYTFEGRVDVKAHAEGDHIQIDVADTGIGITPEDQAKLFTRFFRGSNARDLEISGTGLGLSIARSLVELHGGRLWVKSVVNEGSTFSFTVPRLPAPLVGMAPAALEAVPSAEAPPTPETAKIMIVDDELHIAQLFRYQLEKDGHTIIITTRAAETLQLARREKPDMILLDVMMPGANGFEVLRQIKQDAEMRSVSVIMVSVVADEERGFALGAADYLTKPIDSHLLQTTVRRVLAQRRISRPWSILVVDDEDATRHWLSATLTKQGLQVTEAKDGQEALDCMAAARPDLILLDWDLPQTDGWTMISTLKQSPQTAGIPLLVLTDKQMETADRARLLEMGVQQCLTKPVAVEMLVREIRGQLVE